MDRDALEQMLATTTKRRHEIECDRIRALYGHSEPDRVKRYPATPPARLFHGTAPETWAVIQVDGLLPMGRQFVHLSMDRETATLVGRRQSFRPVVVRIDAAAAASAGVRFYEGNELVWLAERVPARFTDDVR